MDEWCETCGKRVAVDGGNSGLLECSHRNPAHLATMRRPHPEQAAIDAGNARLLAGGDGPDEDPEYLKHCAEQEALEPDYGPDDIGLIAPTGHDVGSAR
jgi:hypothetical protein